MAVAYEHRARFLMNFGPETASYGPGRRSRLFEILNVAELRLRFRKGCGLVPNHNLQLQDRNWQRRSLLQVADGKGNAGDVQKGKLNGK